MTKPLENILFLTKKGLILLFCGQKDLTGRKHTKSEMDEVYMCTDTLCSSYLNIDNSHTHTYLEFQSKRL
jgi:hypothetical protein